MIARTRTIPPPYESPECARFRRKASRLVYGHRSGRERPTLDDGPHEKRPAGIVVSK